MAKITRTIDPVSGKESDLLNFNDHIAKVLGMLGFMALFAFAQRVGKMIEDKTKIDTSPTAPFESPKPILATNPVGKY